MKKKQTVVIALSGGVDSSVAALILKNAGHNVIGLFMKNWHDKSLTKHNECPWVEDSNYALEIANQIEIPFQVIDLSKEYKERIVDYMISEYKKGHTPNPDILCNREIKFDVFLKYALQLKANYIATGHYCIKEEKNGIFFLKKGKDKAKDQSYFLSQINQDQLKKLLFPIGKLTKKEVREIAKMNNLITATKKDSQGLCFVGKIKLPIFLQNQIKNKQGSIIEINPKSELYHKTTSLDYEIKYKPEYGKKIGTHNGAHLFTIGQRKGINIGGKPEPLFVLSTDVNKNIIYVGMGTNHPGLFRKKLKINEKNIHWLIPYKKLDVQSEKKYMVRIRHRQKPQNALLKMDKNYLHIVFEKPQRGIAKGQFAAWYEKNTLVGSGPIA